MEFLTMDRWDYIQMELDENEITCENCKFAQHGIGEMDDWDFSVDRYSEHVFCSEHLAVILMYHRACPLWEEK